MPSFNTISRRWYTPEIAVSRKNLTSESEVANWIIVISSSVFINHWQTLSISFLFEMAIAKDH